MKNSIAASFLIGCVLTTVTGCEWLQGTGDEDYVDDFSELDFGSSPDDDSETGANDTAGQAATDTASLRLNLNVGDRFPLVKNVSQILQQDAGGRTSTSQSSLELMLAIHVDEVREDRFLLRVQYHRVRYRHQLGETIVSYDSDQPTDSVPVEVEPYRGLVNNGFSFWLGRNNRILEAVDFDRFVQRCTLGVVPEQRERVLAGVRSSLGDEGIANFVDDSIGLLPFNDDTQSAPPVKIGERWNRQRQITQPEPINLNSTCTLTALDEKTAEISITGRIGAGQSFAPADPLSPSVKLNMRGGISTGRCTIDRRTGLPVDSRIERQLEMDVQLADGSVVSQRKQIVTSIRAFPQEAAVAAMPAPTSAPDTAPIRDSSVVPAGFTESAPATAVYPDSSPPTPPLPQSLQNQ